MGMHIERFGLELSRDDLHEILVALIQRALVEEDLRHERGLEAVDAFALIERISGMLQISDARHEALAEQIDAELWEYAWYVFTDEWAWFRAQQDVLKETAKPFASKKDLDTVVERRYQSHFESYVAEVDMKNPALTSSIGTKRRQRKGV